MLAWASSPGLGELVDGALVPEESGGTEHDAVVSWLVEELSRYDGIPARAHVKLAVSRWRGRKADVAILASRNHWIDHSVHQPIPPPGALIRLPPTLVVEVLSPSPVDELRDRVEKLSDYAAFGVLACWIVDPRLRLVERFLGTRGGRFTWEGGNVSGRIQVPAHPGRAIDLDEMWAATDAAVKHASR